MKHLNTFLSTLLIIFDGLKHFFKISFSLFSFAIVFNRFFLTKVVRSYFQFLSILFYMFEFLFEFEVEYLVFDSILGSFEEVFHSKTDRPHPMINEFWGNSCLTLLLSLDCNLYYLLSHNKNCILRIFRKSMRSPTSVRMGSKFFNLIFRSLKRPSWP